MITKTEVVFIALVLLCVSFACAEKVEAQNPVVLFSLVDVGGIAGRCVAGIINFILSIILTITNILINILGIVGCNSVAGIIITFLARCCRIQSLSIPEMGLENNGG